MEKDKVESRTDNENTSYYKEVLERQGYIVSRPSVPQQGQGQCPKCGGTDLRIISNHTNGLFVMCKTTGCFTFPVNTSALIALRSEEATGQRLTFDELSNEAQSFIDLWSDCSPEVMKYELLKLLNRLNRAGAPAAGSTERKQFPEPWNQCVHRVFIKGCESCDAFQATFPELADSIKRDMKALAGTDTDVAKEPKNV